MIRVTYYYRYVQLVKPKPKKIQALRVVLWINYLNCYKANDEVTYAGKTYLCRQAHTSLPDGNRLTSQLCILNQVR
ncbi:carbohydrate-binding protein [Paenibacillus alvei]|uniref:carbohydrate-binding protein n=1 Tax=Paenibacillus alvei TaxID=44250 RepID=UPI002B266F26|nr:carbohydrate-binding protein [Paenibacillus alvei]